VKGRKTTFAEAHGIKVRCYGEHVGEHNGLKPMGRERHSPKYRGLDSSYRLILGPLF